MPSKPCLTCGKLTPAGSYCEWHVPKRASRQTPGRGGGWQSSKFRDAVLSRAGHRCEARIGGIRCQALEGLQAHHVVPLVGGGSNDPTNGVCLCRKHHGIVERETAR